LKNNLGVVILAAGKGTRMGGDLPKVLFELKEKALINYVVETSEQLGATLISVVVGYGADKVINHLESFSGLGLKFSEQKEQNGTGHAVQQAIHLFDDFSGNIIVLYGDVPLISSNELKQFITQHESQNNDVTVMTADYPDPTGYGRIIKDNGVFVKIVEQKDCTVEELKVTEINSGIMVFKSEILKKYLSELQNDNNQAEYYLTDMVEILLKNGHKVSAWMTDKSEQVYGVNTPEHLEYLLGYL